MHDFCINSIPDTVSCPSLGASNISTVWHPAFYFRSSCLQYAPYISGHVPCLLHGWYWFADVIHVGIILDCLCCRESFSCFFYFCEGYLSHCRGWFVSKCPDHFYMKVWLAEFLYVPLQEPLNVLVNVWNADSFRICFGYIMEHSQWVEHNLARHAFAVLICCGVRHRGQNESILFPLSVLIILKTVGDSQCLI